MHGTKQAAPKNTSKSTKRDETAQPSQDKLCQVKWEIVCISFMHHFHPQIGTIQDVLPAIDDMALCVQQARRDQLILSNAPKECVDTGDKCSKAM
jgi:hypothetical protein